MNNIEKAKEVFGLIVSGAAVIVALSELWSEVGPKVKAIIGPFINDCKKLTDNGSNNSLQAI